MLHKSKGRIISLVCALILLGAGCYAGAEFLPVIIKNDEETTSVIYLTENCESTTVKEIITVVTSTKPVTSDEKTSATETQVSIIQTKTETRPITTSPTVVALDYTCFENSAFIGNSRVLALKTYGFVNNVYGSVGLTVETVFFDSVSGSNVPVIDELNGKNFDKIFILFGDNECGWPDPDNFIRHYAKVISAVKERVPDAEIYLQSVLPVSRHAEEITKYGCTNSKINILNSKIKALADAEGIYFIEPSKALMDIDGKLPDEASSDGIHLNKKYCKKWLNYLVENVVY